MYLNVDTVAVEQLDCLGVVSPERGVVERRESVPVLGVDAGARPRQHLDGRRQAATLPLGVPLVGLVGTVPVSMSKNAQSKS